MDLSELEIRAEELKARLDAGDSPVVVDVRWEPEWNLCRLPGSRWIPLDQLDRALRELDPAQEVVVVCHHGRRSLDAARFLRAKGFAKAKSLAGGIDYWSQAIDPAVPRY